MSNKRNLSAIRAVGGARYIIGYQQITSVSSATGLTVPDLDPLPPTVYAVIQCEGTAGNYVRWRDDLTDPTASVGMQLFCGNELNYHGQPLTQIKFIDGAGTNKLNISYYS